MSDRSNIRFCMEWNGLPKTARDEIRYAFCYDPELPAWMIAKDNGGPGLPPKGDEEAEWKWSDAYWDFVKERYPGLRECSLEEDSASYGNSPYSFFEVHGHDYPDHAAEDMEKGVMKLVSDVLAHHGLDNIVCANLVSIDDCQAYNFAASRAGVVSEHMSDFDVKRKAEKELCALREKGDREKGRHAPKMG